MTLKSKIKKYESAARYIAEKVISRLQPGDKLPPEKQLADETGVSLMTLRRGIELLSEQGLVDRIPEKRAVVADPGKTSAIKGRSVKILILRLRDDSFYSELVLSIQQAMAAYISDLQFNVVVGEIPAFAGLSKEDQTIYTEKAILDAVKESHCDGVLLIPGFTSLSALERKLNLLGVAMLAFLAQESCKNYLTVNMASGAYAGLCYLRQCGCKHPLFVGVDSNFAWERQAGALRFFREYFPFADPSEMMISCRGTIDEGYEAFNRVLDKAVPVDGIMAHNDLCAVGIMMAARKRGIRLPDDLAVVGFDDLMNSSEITPSLTTMVQPRDQIAMEIIQSFNHIFSHKLAEVSNRSILQPYLLVRESTSGFKPKY